MERSNYESLLTFLSQILFASLRVNVCQRSLKFTMKLRELTISDFFYCKLSRKAPMTKAVCLYFPPFQQHFDHVKAKFFIWLIQFHYCLE